MMQILEYLREGMLNHLFYASLSEKLIGYIDPGLGSYIFQALIAGFFGALVAVKLCWNSIKTFSKRIFSKDNKKPHNEE